MKILALSRSILLALAGLTVVLAASATGDATVSERSERPDKVVNLDDSGSGSACVMVFGSVGRPFAVALGGPSGRSFAQCEEGLSAGGAPCVLPEGIAFDQETGLLRGVPQKAGFHEFVLLVTEKGVTRERVFLIDIQDESRTKSLNDYAFHFFGGIR